MPINCAFIMNIVHSSCYIAAVHAWKGLLLVYLCLQGEVFIRILTIVLKVGRITKNATFK